MPHPGGTIMATKKTRKVGRDAGTGEFIPVKEARRRKKSAVVERVPVGKRKSGKKGSKKR
jgi:hypothetical protein